jgi:integrase
VRTSISPFLRGNVWWARIPRLDAAPVQRALDVVGKEHRDTARQVCDFLRWLRGRRESWLLDQLATGGIAVGAAYTAYGENRLDQFIVDARDGVKDADLEPFVAKWQRELERRKKPNPDTRAKYLRQVRTLIPAGQPFRRSQFTKQRIREWLSGLAGQTNRHRAALSSFGQFLMLEDVLPTNPVRQVPMVTEASPRTLHLTADDAKRLVAALDESYRPLHALMLATGMEVSAALAVRRRDVDFKARTVFARGTKRASRERTCHVYERWDWAWQLVSLHVTAAAILPDAKIFPHLTGDASLDALRSALKATKLDESYRQHDHRHTWAVQAIRDGIDDHAIAYQLGHANAGMLRRVYGRYRPDRSDFDRNATHSATVPLKAAK